MLRKLFTLGLATWALNVFAIDFNRYHSEDDINQYLRQVAAEHPNLVKFQVAGTSDENREIAYVAITKGNENLPGLFFNGTHHGNEWSSTEGILGLIDYLVAHESRADVSELLSNYVFYLEPMVNPDGHHRKTREDVNGVDPNRDYLFPGGSESSAFQTKIIRVMREFVDKKKIRAAVAYHSGTEEVLWPWCYTSEPTKDKDLFYTLAKKTSAAMNFGRYLQSYFDYETEGEFIDYLYLTQGTLALTFEVSDDFIPGTAQLPSIVARSVEGALAFARSVRDLDRGALRIEKAPRRPSLIGNPRWKTLGRRLE